MFKEIGAIEKYGAGITRVLEAFAAYGLPVPGFENFQGGFRVTVYSDIDVLGHTLSACRPRPSVPFPSPVSGLRSNVSGLWSIVSLPGLRSPV